MTLGELVHDPAAEWVRAEPAPEAAVEALAEALPDLPPDYLAFLRLSNGGEGPLGVAPGRFELWPAEEVAALNAAYSVAEFLPGFAAFGSDGGGEMLVFGARPDVWGRVFVVPFIPLEESSAREVARDFAALARTFGHHQ